MGTYRADVERLTSATSRIALLVTPTAAVRLAQLARQHQMTRAALMRASVEAWVHASETERRTRLPPAGPPPPPERATLNIVIAVTPETAHAVETLAVRTARTKTAVIRSALETAAADSGAEPLFAPSAHRQRWPAADLERRRRGPAARLPGIARRMAIGFARPHRSREASAFRSNFRPPEAE